MKVLLDLGVLIVPTGNSKQGSGDIFPTWWPPPPCNVQHSSSQMQCVWPYSGKVFQNDPLDTIRGKKARRLKKLIMLGFGVVWFWFALMVSCGWSRTFLPESEGVALWVDRDPGLTFLSPCRGVSARAHLSSGQLLSVLPQDGHQLTPVMCVPEFMCAWPLSAVLCPPSPKPFLFCMIFHFMYVYSCNLRICAFEKTQTAPLISKNSKLLCSSLVSIFIFLYQWCTRSG